MELKEYRAKLVSEGKSGMLPNTNPAHKGKKQRKGHSGKTASFKKMIASAAAKELKDKEESQTSLSLDKEAARRYLLSLVDGTESAEANVGAVTQAGTLPPQPQATPVASPTTIQLLMQRASL